MAPKILNYEYYPIYEDLSFDTYHALQNPSPYLQAIVKEAAEIGIRPPRSNSPLDIMDYLTRSNMARSLNPLRA